MNISIDSKIQLLKITEKLSIFVFIIERDGDNSLFYLTLNIVHNNWENTVILLKVSDSGSINVNFF